MKTGKPDFSATIRMPELKIPKSMINVDPENASSAAGYSGRIRNFWKH